MSVLGRLVEGIIPFVVMQSKVLSFSEFILQRVIL
jgi:hypothetical protein